MIIGPRYKIGKRLGASVFEKCQTQKFQLSEARSKKKKRRPKALSDYGKQLLEKQKLRYTYGVSEKQLSKYVSEATQAPTDPATRLYQILELRLDNIVYRIGLAPTRRFARQLVSHGHITINGRRVTVPSLSPKKGDVIAIKISSKEKGPFTDLTEKLVNHVMPKWLAFDIKKNEGGLIGLPEITSADASLDLGLVLEYYSR